MSLKSLTQFVVVIVAVSCFAVRANAQAVTLQEQLAAQYKLAKLGSDSSGTVVVDEGTLLTVQKGGILGLPYKAVTVRTSTYENGTVHSSDVTHNSTAQKVGKLICGFHKCPTSPDAASDENATKLFKVGDKVYPTKIDVNTDKDQVVMSIVACDTCNKTDPPTYSKANVDFQFTGGTLAKASAGDVEDTIGQLLGINNDSQQAQDQSQQPQQPQTEQLQAQGGPQQPAAQPQQAEPQTVQIGMTPDQVVAVLGKPDQQFNVGPKQIFVYKTASVKVTFVNGQVSDVQ